MKALETAIYSALSTDATLVAKVPGGVYNTVAPYAPAAPYLVFTLVASAPAYSIGAKVYEEYRYQFSVHARASTPAAIVEAVDALDALLDRKTLTVTGETFWLCEKVSDNPRLAAEVDGTLWISGGADFRFIMGA